MALLKLGAPEAACDCKGVGPGISKSYASGTAGVQNGVVSTVFIIGRFSLVLAQSRGVQTAESVVDPLYIFVKFLPKLELVYGSIIQW